MNVTIFCSYGQETTGSLYTLAGGRTGDWFGGILYSASQQANVAVQDQLSALSFTRSLSFQICFALEYAYGYSCKIFMFCGFYVYVQFSSHIWCWAYN